MQQKYAKVVGGSGDTTQGATATYQDNLYLAINGEWLKTAQIPADKTSTGGFSDLALNIEKTLMQDFADFAAGNKVPANDLLATAVKFYQVAADFKRRNQEGFKPAQAGYESIKNLTNFQSWQQQLPKWLQQGYPLPFNLGIDADMKDTSKNVVYAAAPGLILPDTTYYYDNASGEQLLKIYQQVAVQLLVKIGESEADAQEITQQALQFDRSLVDYVKSAEEQADYVQMYNPQKMTAFASQGGQIDFATLINQAVNDEVTQVIVTEPRFFKHFAELVNDQTFQQLKNWTLVQYVFNCSSLLSQDFREIAGQYSLALRGNQELSAPVKQAYNLTSATFSEVIGQYYGEEYFGHKAKADVEQMIHKMISIYQRRIKNNTWLGTATKEKAVVKLDKMVLKIGYPTKVNQLYQQFKVDPQQSLLSNMREIDRLIIADNFAKYHRPVDRNEWAMPGHMVNACYDPSRNDITFPAAILQAPFYSLQQSASENYGGIGAVIAHEISHGFDNNGAQFDEFGNMNNWWTDEDYETFKQLTQAMIDEFEGLDFAGGKVNGKLVVSENVADAGGLSCALEAAKDEPDADLKEFFINWARIWRTKSTQQLMEMYLSIDVHAPAPLRANVQAQNMDDFYTTFGITSKDGMWLAPEKRVNIW